MFLKKSLHYLIWNYNKYAKKQNPPLKKLRMGKKLL